jgi:hypothetical protein
MAIKKYIKNITLSNLPVINRDLEPNEVWEIPSRLWTTLYEDEDVVQNLIDNKIEISTDGINALQYDAAIKLIEQFQPDSSGFGQRYVISDVNVKQNEEMILSDFVEITEDGTIDVSGLLTILGE